jgi:hypothetical protein
MTCIFACFLSHSKQCHSASATKTAANTSIYITLHSSRHHAEHLHRNSTDTHTYTSNTSNTSNNMMYFLSEAAMDKLFTLATEAQHHKAAIAILVVVLGGTSYYLLVPRRKPARKPETVVRSLPIPFPKLPLTFPQAPLAGQPLISNEQSTGNEQQLTIANQPLTDDEQFGIANGGQIIPRSQPTILTQALNRVPAPINTLLNAAGIEIPKITPPDKVVHEAPASYGDLAPSGKGLEMHEEFPKQKAIDAEEAARLAKTEEAGRVLEEKMRKEEEQWGPGPSIAGRRASDLARIEESRARVAALRRGGEVVAPEAEDNVDEFSPDSDTDDFESLGGNGEDVGSEDERCQAGESKELGDMVD